jgi:hypothetical protein
MTADIRTDVRVAVTCKAQPRPTTSLFDICSRSRPPSLPPFACSLIVSNGAFLITCC